MNLTHPQQSATNESGPKWFNLPVTFFTGTLTEIRKRIPDFERRPFSITTNGSEQLRSNARLDTIVRLPFSEDNAVVPVGIVSKEYALVKHTTVIDEAVEALESINIKIGDVKAELTLTEYGERMYLSLYLPDKFRFDPGDGHPMALRLECQNSVDGSTRFRALMGWYRLVCSNGLIIGVTRSDMHRRHIGDFQIQDIRMVLTAGLKDSEEERKNSENWRKTPIKPERLIKWCEVPLRKEWGFKAATRAYHIAQSGSDVKIIGQYNGYKPTTIKVEKAEHVPGAPRKSENLFDASQILAWLAKERRDIQEQLEWRERIPGLMDQLRN